MSLRFLGAICIGTLLVSCGKSESPGPDGLVGPRGVIQGVLVDALSGARIPVPALTQNQGIRVLTNQTFKAAHALTGSEEIENQMVGEFFISDVPVNRRYPIVVQAEGYQPFEGYVEIPAKYVERRVVSRTGQQLVVEKPEDNPHMVANIRLYPLGAEAQDLEVQVVQRGEPVKGAMIQLKPVLQNAINEDQEVANRRPGALVDDRNFVIPHDTRLQALRGVSNDAGHVSFSGAQLVLGGLYKVLVLPAEGLAQPSIYEETVTIGLRHPSLSLTQDRYQMVVNLQSSPLEIKAMSTNLQNQGYSSDGSLTVRFNRPIEVTSSSVETMYASLKNAVWASLPQDEPNFGGPETMTFKVENDTLTLAPKFVRTPDLEWETGLAITYHNVFVLPKDQPFGRAVSLANLLNAQGLGSTTVNFVGNGQPRPAPSSLNMTINRTTKRIDAQLTSLFDASGRLGSHPFINGGVEITARKGKLVLVAGSDRYEGESFVLHTDSSGYARRYYRDGQFLNATLSWEPTNSEEPESYDLVARDWLRKLTPFRLAQ